MRLRPAHFVLLVSLSACTERATAPGVCPDFCPGGQIDVVDTTFTDMIERDSAFSGYLEAWGGEVMRVTDVPGVVDSRAIFRLTGAIPPRITNRTGDTTTVPLTMDSVRLRLNILHRDTSATNLWIKIYRLPVSIDTATTFADVLPPFTDSIADSVNLNALLAEPLISDTATLRIWGDTIQTDSAGHTLQVGQDSTLILFMRLDSSQARFVPTDSGVVAFGVRVSQDSLNTIALGASDIGRGPQITWFFNYPDTTAAPKDTIISRFTVFDGFVFDPPTAALDSNLAVGGAPAARSILRVKIPPILRDSADVVRATMTLIPVGPVPGAPADSFVILARPVVADLGSKSPLSTNALFFSSKQIHVNAADSVRLEVTDLIRAWALDTSSVTALVIGAAPEAASYTQMRFYSSRTPAFRPSLHITYVRRYAFGTP